MVLKCKSMYLFRLKDVCRLLTTRKSCLDHYVEEKKEEEKEEKKEEKEEVVLLLVVAVVIKVTH